jgi:hypothetical protein
LVHLLIIPSLVIAFAAIAGCCWLCWQLLRQNGRMLMRLDQLEKRLDQFEFGEGQLTPEMDRAPAIEAAPSLTNGEEKERANRFSSRSLARSKIKRDGLKAGTPAPDFGLPRLVL